MQIKYFLTKIKCLGKTFNAVLKTTVSNLGPHAEQVVQPWHKVGLEKTGMMQKQTQARVHHCSKTAIWGKNLCNSKGTKISLYQRSAGMFLQIRISFHAQ